MSKDAKQKVNDLIAKKASRIKEIKRKSKKGSTAATLILNFLDEVEKVYNVAKNTDEFIQLIEIAARSLDNQMRILDRGVKMEVEWAHTESEDWKDWKVIGVTVNWSSYYQKVHGVDQTEFIDSTALLFGDIE